MPRIKLTVGRIEAHRCPDSAVQVFLWDTEVPGLAVRVTPSGAKAFVFQGRLNGKALRVTLGDVRAWPIESSDPECPGARQEARRLQGMIDRGIDPRTVKAELLAATEARHNAAQRRAAPASEAWAAYVTARTPKWSRRHLADHEGMTKAGGERRTRGRRAHDPEATLPGALVPLLALPLDQLDADCVREWLRAEIVRRPTQAALAFRILRAFLRWCGRQTQFRDQVHADACAASLARDELPKKAARKDCLQREQLKAWFAGVQAIPNPTIAAYLQGLLLTGARRNELATLRWQDVDFKWHALTIHDKVEGERTIPLTPYVAALLRDLHSRNVRPLRLPAGVNWVPSQWVFASPAAAAGHIAEPRLQHNRACAAAGVEGLTLHGLRRSFGTLAEWVECPAGVVAQIQGHKPSATAEKHYRQRPIDLLRMWHTRIEAWILEEAGIDITKQDESKNLQSAHARAQLTALR